MPTLQTREISAASRLDNVRYAIRDLAVLADDVVKQGHKVLSLNVGDPNIFGFQPPAHMIDAVPRLAVLKEIIDNAPGKILCFVPLTSVVNLLYKELNKELSCAVVNGQTSAGDREGIFAAFQQGADLRMLIADPGTMAHGLDLYAAQTVVWYGPTDRTELYLQANRRAHRPGQRHPVTVVQIVGTALEREIYRRLETNENMQGVMLQAVRENKL